MASRAISVKVPTAKVIKALETKLATVNADWENQSENEAKFQKAMDKYKKSLIDYAISNIKKAENFRTNYRGWNNQLNIDFDVPTVGTDFPAEPKREFTQMYEHTYTQLVEDITNALNILKMTDEATVNASTMKSIAQYL
jgi:hypothetical protein